MNSRTFFGEPAQVYGPHWNKYRPSILKLMLAAPEGPQQYQFYNHEFKALKSTEKSFAFELLVTNGKANNASKLPTIAKDLLSILQFSRKATELMTGKAFTFKLDRNFVFHVSQQPLNSEATE
jgi:hypothetical protein